MLLEYSEEYMNAVSALESKAEECGKISRKYAGLPAPDGLHFYASVLFTRMVVIGMSVLRLSEGNRFSKSSIEHWDYASVASLVRNMMDCLNTFLYLCEDGLSTDEWDCRWNIFNLHDAVTRRKIFEFRASFSEANDASSHADEIRERLRKNAYFCSLPEARQKHYLKGSDAYLLAKEEIVRRGGGDSNDFLGLYKFLSVQAHSYPMNFYKMGDVERGRGIHSEVEENYTCICVELATSHLEAARIKYEQLFCHINV